MGQLRTKNAELQAEITRLRAEEENIRKGTTAAVSMDKKCDCAASKAVTGPK